MIWYTHDDFRMDSDESISEASDEDAGDVSLSTGSAAARIIRQANKVTRNLRQVRSDSSHRQGFVAGTSSSPLSEIRSIFKGKKRRVSHKKSGKGATPLRKKAKVQHWKHIISCLPDPEVRYNPSKEEWIDLAKIGLGRLWMHRDLVSEIPMSLRPKEFHALVLSLFPVLISTPYELCKLGGSYHNEVIPLSIPESTSDYERNRKYHPAKGEEFNPYWCPSSLNMSLGKKAQLVIRPVENIRALSTLYSNQVNDIV